MFRSLTVYLSVDIITDSLKNHDIVQVHLRNNRSHKIKDIELIRDTVGLDSLSDSLMQVALLRLENPDMSLQGLGELLDPPVGKSGVNHRLRKIGEKADELRQSMGISV